MAAEPENLVLSLLREMRTDIAEVRSDMKSGFANVASDIHTLDAKIDTQIAVLRKETREQIVGLRRAVVEYHSAVIGHGVLISDIEERVRRLETHTNLPPMGAH